MMQQWGPAHGLQPKRAPSEGPMTNLKSHGAFLESSATVELNGKRGMHQAPTEKTSCQSLDDTSPEPLAGDFEQPEAKRACTVRVSSDSQASGHMCATDVGGPTSCSPCLAAIDNQQQQQAPLAPEKGSSPRLKQLIEAVCDALHDEPSSLGGQVGVNLKQIMTTPVMLGMQVEHRKNGEVTGTAVIYSDGLVLCNCTSCSHSAPKPISVSAFEQHSGSLQKRPYNNIYLSEFDISLSKLGNLVTATLSILSFHKACFSGEAVQAGQQASQELRTMQLRHQQKQQKQLEQQQREEQEKKSWQMALQMDPGSRYREELEKTIADGLAAYMSQRKVQLLEHKTALSWLEGPEDLSAKPPERYTFMRPTAESGELPLILFDPKDLSPTKWLTEWRHLPCDPVEDTFGSCEQESDHHVEGRVRMGFPIRAGGASAAVAAAQRAAAAAGAGAGGGGHGGGAGAGSSRNSNKHKRLFEGEPGALKHGERVWYTVSRKRVLGGYVHSDSVGDKHGILCDHCKEVVSCSTFEAHAGHSNRRNPYNGIFTEDGRSFKEIASSLPEQDFVPGSCRPGNSRLKKGGFSTGRGMLAGAAGQVRNQGAEGQDKDLDSQAERCRAALAELEAQASSCSVCFQTDFDKDNFTDRTVIICDQCEREFHVGCLRSSGRCILEEVPQGDWFCSTDCSRVRGDMLQLVEQGEMECSSEGHTWQVYHGYEGDDSDATANTLAIIQDILQESFDPIIDVVSNQDLLPRMVDAGVQGDWHFEGMFSILLRHQGRPVCAAVIRIFGPYLAELPLIATKFDARRQGHCRILMDAIEGQLRLMGVPTLSLPAASSAVPTWLHGFGFKFADLNELQSVISEIRLLVFPGTQVLYKRLIPPVAGDSSVPSFPFASWPEAAERAKAGSSKLVMVSLTPWEKGSIPDVPEKERVELKISPSFASLASSKMTMDMLTSGRAPEQPAAAGATAGSTAAAGASRAIPGNKGASRAGTSQTHAPTSQPDASANRASATGKNSSSQRNQPGSYLANGGLAHENSAAAAAQPKDSSMEGSGKDKGGFGGRVMESRAAGGGSLVTPAREGSKAGGGPSAAAAAAAASTCTPAAAADTATAATTTRQQSLRGGSSRGGSAGKEALGKGYSPRAMGSADCPSPTDAQENRRRSSGRRVASAGTSEASKGSTKADSSKVEETIDTRSGYKRGRRSLASYQPAPECSRSSDGGTQSQDTDSRVTRNRSRMSARKR